MKETEYYQLSLWDMEDTPNRKMCNTDNEKIDTALAALNDRVYFGSWVGDGTKNRTVQLPFAPRLLLVFGYYYNDGVQALLILATQNNSYKMHSSGNAESSLDFGGLLSGEQFKLGQYPQYNNYSGQTVQYMAMK